MYSIEHKGNMVHDSSTSRNWAATLRSDNSGPKSSWVGAVSKPETTPYRHTKRLSVTEVTASTPKSTTVVHDSPKAAPVRAGHGRRESDLRPVDYVGDDKFSWERTLRSSTQPKPVHHLSTGGSMDDRPWRIAKGTRSAPVSASHTREHSTADPSAPAAAQDFGSQDMTAAGVVPGSAAHSRQASGAAPGSVAHSRRASGVAHSRRTSVAHSRQASGAVHSRQASGAAAPGGAHSRQASGAGPAGTHSRRASGAHSRKPSMAMHSRRSTRASIKFDPEAEGDVIEEVAAELEAGADGAVDASGEVIEATGDEAATNTRDFDAALAAAEAEAEEEAALSGPAAVRTTPAAEDGPQAVKDTLAGSMLVEQAELIASMTVKQVVEQLATGTTVFKAWVRGTKQRGSTRHVKARVANDLVLLQYPSGFSKRQMTVIVSSIYVTVEPTKTVLTLETDNGTLVLKPYTPEHATLWAFGFNALLHLADKQGMMDENTVISDLPWHGIFQSPKEEQEATA